jgi:hypothetical protein
MTAWPVERRANRIGQDRIFFNHKYLGAPKKGSHFAFQHALLGEFHLSGWRSVYRPSELASAPSVARLKHGLC